MQVEIIYSYLTHWPDQIGLCHSWGEIKFCATSYLNCFTYNAPGTHDALHLRVEAVDYYAWENLVIGTKDLPNEVLSATLLAHVFDVCVLEGRNIEQMQLD